MNRRIKIDGWIIPSVLFFVTVIQIPLTPNVRSNFNLMFTLGVMAVLAFYIAKEHNVWIGAFLALSVFSANYPAASQGSYQALAFVMLGCVWFFLCVHFLNTEKAYKTALNFICLIGLANAVMIVLQVFNLDFLHKPRYDPLISGYAGDIPVGMMDCQNSVSAMLVFTSAAFFRWDKIFWKIRWIYLFPLILFGFVMSKTFGGPMALAGAGIVVGFVLLPNLHLKLFFAFMACGLLIIYGALVDMPDVTWRMMTWKTAYDLFPQHPWFGVGLGHWKEVFKQFAHVTDGKIFAQAHMEAGQLVFEYGLVVVPVVIGYFASIYKRWNREALLPFAALIMIVVDSMVFFPFHISLTAMVAITWMAMLEVKLR